MSFTSFKLEPLRTREQIAKEVHAVSLRRGLDPLATVIALMTISTEVGTGSGSSRKWWCPANPTNDPATMAFDHDSTSNDSKSSGYFQQQPPWWGTPQQRMTLAESANMFLEALPNSYTEAAGNPVLAGQYAQRVQKSSYPDRYANKWDEAWEVFNRAIGDSPPQEIVVPEPRVISGDPVWLEDVLRPALGARLRVLPGWKDSGVGGVMGNIWGIIWHHTGNARETAESIRRGRPDLPGPLAQLHISPDGIVTIVGVGPCNHAGRGSWNGLPTDNANRVTIGIECAWPSDTSITEATQTREPWPDAQMRSMIDVGAAITAYLGQDASRNISHNEWATKGPAGWRQGKWDPGNLNMDWFRGEITKTMSTLSNPPSTPGDPVNEPTHEQLTWDVWAQHLGRWEMLGWQTPVEVLAELRDHLLGTRDADKKGWRPA